MARKGSHSKKGSAQNSLKSKKRDPEFRVVSDEPFDVDVEQDNSHSVGGINQFPGDDKDNNSKAYRRACDQKVDASKGYGSSVHDSSITIKGVDSFGSRVFNKPCISDNSSEKRNNADTSVSYTDIWMDRMQFSKIVALESLKHFALSIWRMSWGWLERQKPFFSAVVNHFYRVRDITRMKLMRTYPVVRKWLFHLGNILLLVSVIWLDCAFRGMESFLRMGTTSLLSVLWFSILSVIAMTGVFKFLLVLAATLLIGVLVGFMIALFVTAACGAIILWFYGSFWTTSLVVMLAGLAFIFSYERLGLLITTIYSVYCAWTYVGWLGVLLGLNLSFFSSDALIYFLKNNIDEQRSKGSEQTDGQHAGRNFFNGEVHYQYSDVGLGQSSDRSAGVASTSGTDSDTTSEDEVVRLLNCTDHYSALGLTRYQQVDVSILKREYRKKAMLVHPDKNMGNEKAEEAFKKLQNAYEVLLDSLKRKAYDDELRREEFLNYFCRFQSASQKNGRHDLFPSGFARSEGDGEDPCGEFRRIACKKCGGYHVWLQTKKSKLKARWCQDCKDFHQAKDGDGWVEQSSQPLFFGILQKVDLPVAYVCADGKVFDATEWYICQGMRCASNSHKPSFHVNTNVTRNNNSGKGSSSTHRGGSNMEENMSEEEFFEWLQNAMQSGTFENFGGGPSCESPQANTKNSSKSAATASGGGGGGSSSSRRKKKGKKQW